MTEIPEHLLQRSRERRAAMGGGDGDAADAGESKAQESSSAAPAKAAAPAAASMPAHPAPEEPEPPKPPSPMVQAATTRRKIPFWAMPVIAALPVWAYVYAGTLEPPPKETPETLGAELYAANCAQCHGGSGIGSGAIPGFTEGRVFDTWPVFEDHFEWVRLGSTGWRAEHGDTYGATDKPVAGGMPAFEEGGALTDAQLVYVVLYERHLAGENPDPEDHARLAALADMMFHDDALSLFANPEEGVEEGAIDMLEEMIASGEINLEDFAAE